MRTSLERVIISISGILTVVLLIAYIYIQSREFITGPQITINEPINGAGYSNTILPIRGNAKHAAKLMLDGRQIYTDENGFFDEIVLLSPGYNVIELWAKDRFNREKTKELKVVLK